MWCTGLVAPQHVGSSWTRARTHVPCIGRRILTHCATVLPGGGTASKISTLPFSPPPSSLPANLSLVKVRMIRDYVGLFRKFEILLWPSLSGNGQNGVWGLKLNSSSAPWSLLLIGRTLHHEGRDHVAECPHGGHRRPRCKNALIPLTPDLTWMEGLGDRRKGKVTEM